MFTRLIDELRTQLLAAESTGERSFSIQQTISEQAPLLEWLHAQNAFPKLYWQHRDNTEEVAVCGAAATFDCPQQAQAFLSQHATLEMRLWGLNAFDRAEVGTHQQKSMLFLPRVEWRQSEKTLTLICHLDPSLPRMQALHDARTFFDCCCNAQPLPSIDTVTIQSVQHQPDYENWQRLIEKALMEIGNGHFQKVVLARCSTLQLSQSLSPAAFLAASRNVNARCYHFWCALSPTQSFLGSSPERLYSRQHDTLLTEAVAGTVANDANDEQAQRLADWLMHDPKNLHENQLVVDDISERLKNIAATFTVSPLHVIRLRKVQHLKRAVDVQLTRADDAECLRRLQPTAAVAGLPREAALHFIDHEEPFSRGWYAGTVGYFSQTQAEFAVSLRSALVENQRMKLYAGGGIVAGSQAGEEWREIETKAESLRSLLADHSSVV
jgi:isochorismate synthases